MSISIGSNHFKNSVINGQKRHIESSAAQIKHQNVLLSLLLVETISNGRRSGLVDDPHDIEASDKSGIFRGLPLGVVEVGRDSYDSVNDLLAKVGLGGLLHFGQDHGGDLLGSENLVALARVHLDVGFAVLFHNLTKRFGFECEVLYVAEW